MRQQISVSPSDKMGDNPIGKIELTVPYDGHEFFTRQAVEDVRTALTGNYRHGEKARVGHLLLHEYSKTDLGPSLSLADSHGAVPIEVLLGDTADPAWLSADRRTCVNTCEFTPGNPEVIPAKLEVVLYDPDSLDILRVQLEDLDLVQLKQPDAETYARVNSIISQMKQQVSFRNDLLLRIQVGLTVPVRADAAIPDARVARMAIGWPTITSPRTLSLHTLAADNEGKVTKVPVRYNPEKTSLEWENIRFDPGSRKRDKNLVQYASPLMLLSVQHPGELYQRPKLEIHGELEVSGYLLSGLEAQLYEADGRLSQQRRPELTTRVDIDATLMLDDAFAKRDFTPSQHLFFDEVIPAETRITDIRNSLEERGFDVSPSSSQPLPGSSEETVRWFLMAQRQEGPYTMKMWIAVEGRNFITTEETTRGGGQTHTTQRQTGDLQIFIRGTLPRDSRALTNEMNTLHQTLRERYSRVRQRR
ncbi:MAG TPA: hypothetical protein VGH27_08190 [Streptosporangiaceae bacterium]